MASRLLHFVLRRKHSSNHCNDWLGRIGYVCITREKVTALTETVFSICMAKWQKNECQSMVEWWSALFQDEDLCRIYPLFLFSASLLCSSGAFFFITRWCRKLTGVSTHDAFLSHEEYHQTSQGRISDNNRVGGSEKGCIEVLPSNHNSAYLEARCCN
jgi:hypothetical protein